MCKNWRKNLRKAKAFFEEGEKKLSRSNMQIKLLETRDFKISKKRFTFTKALFEPKEFQTSPIKPKMASLAPNQGPFKTHFPAVEWSDFPIRERSRRTNMPNERSRRIYERVEDQQNRSNVQV